MGISTKFQGNTTWHRAEGWMEATLEGRGWVQATVMVWISKSAGFQIVCISNIWMWKSWKVLRITDLIQKNAMYNLWQHLKLAECLWSILFAIMKFIVPVTDLPAFVLHSKTVLANCYLIQYLWSICSAFTLCGNSIMREEAWNWW